MAKVPRIIKVPAGEAWVSTENPLGEMGYYVVSKGDLGPFRVKIRSASFNNISIVPWVLRGVYVPDVITILGEPLLHPRGHRPVMHSLLQAGVLAADLPYWGQSLLRVLGVLVAVLLPAGTIVYVYPLQDGQLHAEPPRPDGGRPLRLDAALRRGRQVPPEGGHRPRARRPLRLRLAPIVVLISTFLVYLVVPFGPDAVFADSRRGIFFALAVSSLSVLGILMAGWASANKYSLIGGLRAAGQLIAYELPMVLAVVGVVIQAGTLNMQRHRRRPGRRRDLRLGRHRQPVHPHAVRRRSSCSSSPCRPS